VRVSVAGHVVGHPGDASDPRSVPERGRLLTLDGPALRQAPGPWRPDLT